MVKLSIIIPTYNSSATIQKLMASILNQDCDFNYEIICIDDGSTDDTWSILSEYSLKSDQVRSYKQRNQKQAAARNNGLKHATGKYVMFADADDFWRPGLLKQVFLTENKLTIFGIEKKYKSERVFEVKSALTASTTPQEILQNYLAKNLEMDVGVWNKVFLRKLIEEKQLAFTNENFFEDSLFVLDYLSEMTPADINYVEKPLYVLIKQGHTTTSHFSPDIINKSNRYYRIVKQRLVASRLDQRQIDALLIALRSRLLIHVSHHYIQYSPTWSANWEKNFLQESMKTTPVLKNNLLSMKYKVSWIGLRYFPRVYKLLYRKYKPSLS